MVDVAGSPVVAVLTRAPSAGGKTRVFDALARAPDPELLSALLLDTLDAVATAGAPCIVAYTPASAADEMRALVPAGVGLLPQRDGDLGARMQGVFDELLARGAPAVVVVGSDLPAIQPALVEQAIAILGDRPDDVVLGPAADGGYYLIAARRTPVALFAGINWGKAGVLNESLAAAKAAGLLVSLLPPAHDVDTLEELRDVAAMHNEARRTRAWWMRVCSGGAMAIQWRKDVDAALAEAKSAGRHVLLDFSAAPM